MDQPVPTFQQLGLTPALSAAPGQAFAPAAPPRQSVRGRLPGRITGAHKYLYVLWFIILCDPQWYLRSFFGRPILQVPTLLFAVLLVMVLLKGPRHLNWAMLATLGYTALMLPFAQQRHYAMGPTKMLVIYYVLAVATLTYVRTVRQAIPIIMMALFFQFAWWGGWGAKSGLVAWHPHNANYDGYGPLMAIGIGTTYYLGASLNKSRKWKIVAWGTAALCVIGLVSAFARGAVLAGAAVLVFMWLRAPRKGVATLVLVGALGVTTLAANVFFKGTARGESQASFWAEMSTIFESEDDATASDRKVLWALAVRVWKEKPIFGVGAANFGPYAAENFAAGTVGGQYDENPLRLYDRTLHSSYYQVLCEYGVVGSALFILLLADFWRRNRTLRRKDRLQYWSTIDGGRFNLYHLACAVECAMVAFLASAVFYNQLFTPWLYFIITVNVMLYELSKPPKLSVSAAQPRRSGAPGPAFNPAGFAAGRLPPAGS